MSKHNRRSVLKAGAAFAGVSALGFPAIVHAQADKIKIGHLTPLTGFLGALGAYAQFGLSMAEEEINKAGGVMGRPSSTSSRKIRSIPPRPRPRPSACWIRMARLC